MVDDRGLPSMRAADADRERVLEVVRQALAEGRLSTPEFYERLDGIYRAKTYAELDQFAADLPVGSVPESVAPPPRAGAVAGSDTGGVLAQMPKRLRELWVVWATVVSINVLVWLILALTSVFTEDGAPRFWPIWVAGPWGVVNAGITLGWLLNHGDEPEPSALPPGSR
jgi:hypothetical protein